MSVRARADDAKTLYEAHRIEGCLLMLLVAVAATSRKRYPKTVMKDGDAFKEFLHDEMKTVTGCTLNFNLKFRGETQPLQDVLYHFVRCELAHEGTIPSDFVLDDRPGFRVEVTDAAVTFSEGLLDGLFAAIVHAPENKNEFADVLAASPSDDTIGEVSDPCQ